MNEQSLFIEALEKEDPAERAPDLGLKPDLLPWLEVLRQGEPGKLFDDVPEVVALEVGVATEVTVPPAEPLVSTPWK